MLVHVARTWVGKPRTVGALRTSNRAPEPYSRGIHGEPPLSRRLLYLPVLLALPGFGAPAADRPGLHHRPARVRTARRGGGARSGRPRDRAPVQPGDGAPRRRWALAGRDPLHLERRRRSADAHRAARRRGGARRAGGRQRASSTAPPGTSSRRATPTATGSSTGSTAPATIACSRGSPTGGGAGKPPARSTHPVRARVLAESRARRAGGPVLVLLPVQRMGEPSRGRLGARQRDPVRPRPPRLARPTTVPSATSSISTASGWTPRGRSVTAITRWSSSAVTGTRSGGRAPRAAAATPGPRRIPAPAAASVRWRSPTTREHRRASWKQSGSRWSCCPSPRGSTPARTRSCLG